MIEGYEKAWMAGAPVGVAVPIILWWIMAQNGLFTTAPAEELVLAAFVGLGSGLWSAFGAYMARTTTPEIKAAETIASDAAATSVTDSKK